jgi:hypothetical protein
MEITITIGQQTRTYTLCITTAPRDYDYNGVLEIYNAGDERYILVPLNKIVWQRGRNASGLKTLKIQPEDRSVRSWAENKLWLMFTRSMD